MKFLQRCGQFLLGSGIRCVNTGSGGLRRDGFFARFIDVVERTDAFRFLDVFRFVDFVEHFDDRICGLELFPGFLLKVSFQLLVFAGRLVESIGFSELENEAQPPASNQAMVKLAFPLFPGLLLVFLDTPLFVDDQTDDLLALADHRKLARLSLLCFFQVLLRFLV